MDGACWPATPSSRACGSRRSKLSPQPPAHAPGAPPAHAPAGGGPHAGLRTAWRSPLHEVRPAPLAAREPAARDRLLPREELDGVGAVGVEVAEERVLPAGEREERDGGRDADVDAHHP